MIELVTIELEVLQEGLTILDFLIRVGVPDNRSHFTLQTACQVNKVHLLSVMT